MLPKKENYFTNPEQKNFPTAAANSVPMKAPLLPGCPETWRVYREGYEDILPGGFRKLEWRYRGVDQYKRVTPRADPGATSRPQRRAIYTRRTRPAK